MSCQISALNQSEDLLPLEGDDIHACGMTSLDARSVTLSRHNSCSNHVTLNHVTPPPPPFTCVNTLTNTCAQERHCSLERTSAFVEPQRMTSPLPLPFDDDVMMQPPCTCDELNSYASHDSRAPSVRSAMMTPTPPPLQQNYRPSSSLARNGMRVRETPI